MNDLTKTNLKTLNVETEIKFQVNQTQGNSVDAYGTGDYVSYCEYEVKRKQMICDIPKGQGGTKDCDYNFTDELLVIHNNEGVCKFGTFSNPKLADLFCKALNETDQAELLDLINSDPYKSNIII